MSEVIAIFMFPPTGLSKSDLGQLAHAHGDDRREIRGLVSVDITAYTEFPLDWTCSWVFSSEKDYAEWKDSPSYEDFISGLHDIGVEHDPAFILLRQGKQAPPGFAVFEHRVKRPLVEAFIDLQGRRFIDNVSQFDGFEGAALIPSGANRDLWITVIRFRDEADLITWLRSDSRMELLPELRELLESDFSGTYARTPFGATVRVVAGAPVASPMWKIVLLVVSVLFPTVTILLTFLNPVLTDLHVQPGLGALIGQIIATFIVTGLWMPLMSKAFAWWIDPIDGAPRSRSIAGLAFILAIYLLEIGFFILVPSLTPWGSS